MKQITTFLLLCFFIQSLPAQDLSQGLVANDLALHPMQPIAKPGYLQTIVDPSFGTTIRRITDAGSGNVIVPMYNTIQAWNADESLLMLYNVSSNTHQLFDGMDYSYIRDLDDINPTDLEDVFWDFNDPNVFYYLDNNTDDFTRYFIDSQTTEVIVDLNTLGLGCVVNTFEMGNDIQMMSWDSDVFSFRCANDEVFVYRISTGQATQINVTDVNYVAAAPGPSGQYFLHRASVYDNNGNYLLDLNSSGGEHSCMGKISNGNDAYFAVVFDPSPNGGCFGNLVMHDLQTGTCTELISQNQGYDYSQSGTHMSALAHKNTDDAWVAASMIGFDEDGQDLLDQELVLVRADPNNIEVFRIGHHRSDENEFDYWGEPHAVLSPTGTRVLFGSDWSGAEDGQSIDCYVVELPAHNNTSSNAHIILSPDCIEVFPNPFTDQVVVDGNFSGFNIRIYDSQQQEVANYSNASAPLNLDLNNLGAGMYFISVESTDQSLELYKIIKY